MNKMITIALGLVAALTAIPAWAERINFYNDNQREDGVFGSFQFNPETQLFSNSIVHFFIRTQQISNAWADWNHIYDDYCLTGVIKGKRCVEPTEKFATVTLSGYILPILDMSIFYKDSFERSTLKLDFDFTTSQLIRIEWRMPSGRLADENNSPVSFNVSSSIPYSTDWTGVQSFEFSAPPIPEPETYALLLAGFGALGTAVRRRKARQV